jgi:PAS domain S-box-containing protein
MKLRLILVVLAILAFSSASTSGILYYNALRDSAFKDARHQAATRVELLKRNLWFSLSEDVRAVRVMAGMAELLEFLTQPSPLWEKRANDVLDHFNRTLNTDVCYLMNREGVTVASSNRNAPDSFVGQKFDFRPYFTDAFTEAPSSYMAVGTTSNRRGVYHGYPIFKASKDDPVGVAVIKASIETIEKELDLGADEIILVTDPNGLIFISNRTEWLFQFMEASGVSRTPAIAASRQFGDGPWHWAGLTFEAPGIIKDNEKKRYLVNSIPLSHPYPGWQVVLLSDLSEIQRRVNEPLAAIVGPIVLSLCVMVGISVLLLYRKASLEIENRRQVETALRLSEERYRSLYHHTPAMMHSIDAEGRLLSVSDHWSEALGYSIEEVVGKPLTDFFAPESRKAAIEQTIPDFFKTGYCKDIPYQFVRLDGTLVDVLLSAIADRNEAGEIQRSLAVSIDVTDRKKAEEALHLAKERLSRYSSELERQVAERTREITGILKYSPAVIYIKDGQGRYVLVNSRFEEIFGILNEEIHGKTDSMALSTAVAQEFQKNDQRVLIEKKPCQFTEHIPQTDGMHTYLSVKFPIYDDLGNVSTVCGIATDITELEKAQNRLRRLSGSILNNQEKERTAIARELHDELGQMLTALRMDAVWIRDRLRQGDPKGSERANLMCQLVDQSIANVRDMAVRLRPGVLDDLGLVDALEWFTANFEKRTGITSIFDHGEVPSLEDAVATTAYRVTQEALTNVARHAYAGQVIVKLACTAGMLTLSVTDNGLGISPDDLSRVESLGISGMRERASLVGGTLEIRPADGGGTRVLLSLPLNPYHGETL